MQEDQRKRRREKEKGRERRRERESKKKEKKETAKTTDRLSINKLPTLTLPENILGNSWLLKCFQSFKRQNYRRPVFRRKVALGIAQATILRTLA